MLQNQNQDIFSKFDEIDLSSASGKEAKRGITLWVAESVHEMYLDLQNRSERELGKELQSHFAEIIKRAYSKIG